MPAIISIEGARDEKGVGYMQDYQILSAHWSIGQELMNARPNYGGRTSWKSDNTCC